MIRITRRTVGIVGWNLLLAAACVAVILIAGEIYTRTTVPFTDSHRPLQFARKVGFVLEPGAEMRRTNGLDFWTVSRTNSLGFLDREPPGAGRAAGSCHITMIGDSMVEASEVPIPDKFHVRLEDLAARELPHLDVTTSAFGLAGTGQISQLPFYDEYARRLDPKLLVLVFVANDFADNNKLLKTLTTGWGPDRMPYVYAEKGVDGTISLLPPDPDPDWDIFRTFRTPWMWDANSGAGAALIKRSRFGHRLARQLELSWSDAVVPAVPIRAELLLHMYPGYRSAFGSWRPADHHSVEISGFFTRDPAPVYKDALEFTAFALDEFRKRADRDGFSLIILQEQGWAEWMKQMLTPMAKAREIPVVSLQDHMNHIGAEVEDARWPHDGHWSVAGHRWAAEALLGYLQQNQTICTG